MEEERMVPVDMFLDRTAVYELYDENHVLLYIGKSRGPVTRVRSHLKEHRWSNNIAYVSLEMYPSKKEAEEEEEERIREKMPLHNRQYNERRWNGGITALERKNELRDEYDTVRKQFDALSKLRPKNDACLGECSEGTNPFFPCHPTNEEQNSHAMMYGSRLPCVERVHTRLDELSNPLQQRLRDLGDEIKRL